MLYAITQYNRENFFTQIRWIVVGGRLWFLSVIGGIILYVTKRRLVREYNFYYYDYSREYIDLR
jgi:hypothetical protein